MTKTYWTIGEVIKITKIEESFINELEREDIICPVCSTDSQLRQFSAMDLDNLRLARMLVEEMEVNLPGVDIILRMRQAMIDMRKQFDDILDDISDEMRRNFNKKP